MSKNIAFISGKGGSGKTSLSLAFSKTLSNSGLKVLLIDCDMSTHGATFFMKPQIENRKKTNISTLSVDDILNFNTFPPYGFLTSNFNETNTASSEVNLDKLIEVEENLFFLPSDISITNDKLTKNKYFFDGFETFIKEELSLLFDIIILDCQAGYSDFTRCILRNSHTVLLVSEPDSVSAAANKALCFQLGYELDKIPVYQIFSKITEEEALHYSKTYISSFFTNLSPIIFDLKLRKTFIYLKIPSAATVSIDFESNILNMLIIIIPEHKEKIQLYKNELYDFHRHNLSQQLFLLEERSKMQKRKSLFNNSLRIIPLTLGILTALTTLIFFELKKLPIDYIPLVFIIFIFSIVLVSLPIIFTLKKQKDYTDFDTEILDTKKQLNDLYKQSHNQYGD